VEVEIDVPKLIDTNIAPGPTIIEHKENAQVRKKGSILDELLEDLEDENNYDSEIKFTELIPDNIPIIWEAYISTISDTAHGSYLPIAQKSKPIFDGEATLVFSEDNSISLGFMEKNKAEIQLFFKEKTGKSLQLKFELNKTESNEKKKVFKTTKEKFKEMAEINPVLLELQKRLELDFEY
jgi:hypothetical protein